MGLLDFLETPTGQALASGVASYAVNARRGRPVNSIGAGLMGGIQGYSGAIEGQRKAVQDEQRNEYNRKQQELLGFEYQSRRTKAEADMLKAQKDAQNERAEEDLAKQMWASMFEGSGYDPNTLQPIKVSTEVIPREKGTWGDMESMAPDNVYVQKETPNPVNMIFDELGYTPGRRKMMEAHLKNSPEKAIPLLHRDYVSKYKSSLGGEIKPTGELANYMLLNGGKMPTVDEFRQYKLEIARAGAAQQNNYGTSLTPAVNAEGQTVFIQPSKSGDIKVHEGFMPQNDAEQLAKSVKGAKSISANLDRFASEVRELKNHEGLKYAVGKFSILPDSPLLGQKRMDAITKIQALASKAAVAAINDMRAMSSTGGAVGQVTEKEWPKLEAQMANLARAQSYEEYVRELGKLESLITNTKQLINQSLSAMPQPKQAPSKSSGAKRYNPATGRIE